MKWAITGGSGQLARSLVNLLSEAAIPHFAWNHVELDVSDPISIPKILEFQPSVLVNCAAWTNVEEAEDSYEKALKVNQDGVRNVATAARELDIPLIHISTDYVFSGFSTKPWRIDDLTQPISKYGMSKLLGEQVLLEVWPEKSYIVRTAWLYGPYGRNFVKTILKKAIQTKDEIFVVDDQTGQPTSTFDLATRLFRISESKLPAGTYHGTNSGQATWWEFAREIVALSGNDVNRVIPVSSEKFPSKVNRPKFSVLDHSSWSKVGFEPMKDWRIALSEVFPRILDNVMKELARD